MCDGLTCPSHGNLSLFAGFGRFGAILFVKAKLFLCFLQIFKGVLIFVPWAFEADSQFDSTGFQLNQSHNRGLLPSYEDFRIFFTRKTEWRHVDEGGHGVVPTWTT